MVCGSGWSSGCDSGRGGGGGGRWSSGEEGGVVKWCVVEVHQLKGMDQDIQ